MAAGSKIRDQQSKKRKKHKNDLPHIAAALVPTATFAAVPRTPPPPKTATLEYTAGLSSALLNSTMLGRMFATNTPTPIDDDGNDADTSLDDYNEVGYSSIRRGDNGGIIRARMRTPPIDYTNDSPLEDNDLVGDGFYSQPIDTRLRKSRMTSDHADYSFEAKIDNTEVLYATPHKKIVELPSLGDLDISRPADVHRLDYVEEPLIASSTSRPEEASMSMTSPVFSDFDTKGSTDMEGEQFHHLKKKSHGPRIDCLAKESEDLSIQQSHIQHDLDKKRRQHDELRSKISDKKGVSDEDREKLIDQQLSMTDNTLRSQDELIDTLHDRIRTLEYEKTEHHEVNTQLQREIESFRQFVQDKGSQNSSDGTRRQVQDLKDENDTLKATVHRLNIELSRLQAIYRRYDENKNITGLPSKGPVPSWLINTKYLAPLFLAYDDRLAELSDIIKQYEIEQESFQLQVEDIVKQNQRLHIKLEQNSNCTMTEWQQLQEQAKLVLEENEVLMERLSVQQEKAKDMHTTHVREVSRYSKQIVSLQQAKEDLESELTEMKQRYHVLKNKHNSLIMETESHLSQTEHNLTITEIKRTVDEVKETHYKEVADIQAKFQSSEQERKNVSIQNDDFTAQISQMEIEIKGLQRSLKRSQKRVHILQKALEVSEDKESSANEYLTSLLKAAEQASVERDTYAHLVKSHEQERRRTMKSATEGNIVVGKMEEKIQLCKEKCTAKLAQAQGKIKALDERFDKEKWEYERQIRHLNLLLKEKDGIIDEVEGSKRQVENDLEVMWQAASADNRRIKDTMEKTFQQLKEHKNLDYLIKKDSDTDRLLVSSDA